MTNYESILAAAAQLSPAERVRLIDDLAATTPDDCPPLLPPDWEAELNRRWEEIQSGKVATVPWEQVKKQLFSKTGLDLQIEFHPAALLDLESSLAWYDSQSERAARNFVIAIDQAMEKIQTQPNRFAIITNGFRGCSVSGFPFQVVFQWDSDRIYVIAIAHAKRRPNFWVQRIT